MMGAWYVLVGKVEATTKMLHHGPSQPEALLSGALASYWWVSLVITGEKNPFSGLRAAIFHHRRNFAGMIDDRDLEMERPFRWASSDHRSPTKWRTGWGQSKTCDSGRQVRAMCIAGSEDRGRGCELRSVGTSKNWKKESSRFSLRISRKRWF